MKTDNINEAHALTTKEIQTMILTWYPHILVRIYFYYFNLSTNFNISIQDVSDCILKSFYFIIVFYRM